MEVSALSSFCFFQWRQADSIKHLGKVTLAQEQDYTALVVGCVCVSLLLLLLGMLLMWKRNKNIDGKSRARDSRVLLKLVSHLTVGLIWGTYARSKNQTTNAFRK